MNLTANLNTPKISARRSPPSPLFDLNNPAECFMAGVWRRRHRGRRYQPLAIKRMNNDKGERIMLELAKCLRANAAPKWLLIVWNSDGISISFKKCPTKAAALSAYLGRQ